MQITRGAQSGLTTLLRLATPWVVLLGHESYYPRFGFAHASRWNLTGDYGRHDTFQFLPLTDSAQALSGGHIRYAPEFGELLGSAD
jgi:putative acetyltransferase